MHNLPILVLALAAISVAGCDAAALGNGGHPTCRDAISTQDYGVKWMDEIAKARQDNKLTVDQVVDAQGKAFEKLSLLKREDWAGYCNHLDRVREDTGF